MKKILFIICFFIGLQGFSQEYKCGWYGKKTVEERNQMFPFNKTKKVVLIAYANYEIGSELSGTLSLEEARAIDPNIIYKYEFVFSEDRFAKVYFATEVKEIDQGWKNELSHLLCNYTVAVKPEDGFLVGITTCYTPRNSILFLDENDAVICCLEICFECRGSYLSPDPEGLNKYADIYECHPRLNEIKHIFSKNGILYGIDK